MRSARPAIERSGVEIEEEDVLDELLADLALDGALDQQQPPKR